MSLCYMKPISESFSVRWELVAQRTACLHPCYMWKLQVSAALFMLLVGMLPICFPSWLVWRPGWKQNAWWTLELYLCANYTLCESLSMQIDQNNVNNVRVPIFTDQAGKKTDWNWTLSKLLSVLNEKLWEKDMIAENIQTWQATGYGAWSVRWPLACRIDAPCREYDIFRDNKEKRNDSHNMGKCQALLPKLGKAQETPDSPNFAVRVGTSPAISSCPRPIVNLWPIHQRGSLRFSVMNSLLPTLLSLSFRQGTARNFKSMYTLGFTTVLFRSRMWPQRAGQLSHTANCSSLQI